MNRNQWIAGAIAAAALATSSARADDTSIVDEGGVRYHVTRQTVQRPITETHYEPRQYTSYRERYTTDMQEVPRTYNVTVTQHQWVPGYQRSLNPFAPPTLSYRLVPVTHVETRTETVRVPVTRRDLVPETQTQHVPVTTQRIVQDTHEHRVALASRRVAAARRRIALRNDTSSGPVGGLNQINDPPRDDSSDQISRRK